MIAKSHITYGFVKSNSPSVWQVGAAKIDISPTTQELKKGDIYLGGFGFSWMRGSATQVHDPIFVRSIAFKSPDNEFPLVISVLDVPGIGNKTIQNVRDWSKQLLNLPGTHIWMGATHTHSGPDLQGIWGGVSNTYLQRVEVLILQSINMAIQALKPAQVRVSKAQATALNRREWDLVDTDMTTLVAYDLTTQKPIATWTNFAAHPIFIPGTKTQVSRDFPGYFVDAMEQLYQAPVAVFSNGIVGDVIPKDYETNHQKAFEYGVTMAVRTLKPATDEAVEVSPTLKIKTTDWTQNISNSLLKFVFRNSGHINYNVTGTKGELKVTTGLSYAVLGEQFSLLAFPGESLTRNGLPIKAEMKTPFRMFLGLTNDTLGYFVPSDEWNSGRAMGYQEKLSMDRKLGDETVLRAVQLINQ